MVTFEDGILLWVIACQLKQSGNMLLMVSLIKILIHVKKKRKPVKSLSLTNQVYHGATM